MRFSFPFFAGMFSSRHSFLRRYDMEPSSHPHRNISSCLLSFLAFIATIEHFLLPFNRAVRRQKNADLSPAYSSSSVLCARMREHQTSHPDPHTYTLYRNAIFSHSFFAVCFQFKSHLCLPHAAIIHWHRIFILSRARTWGHMAEYRRHTKCQQII